MRKYRSSMTNTEAHEERKAVDRVERFTLTEEHVALLCSGRLYVDWQYCETGAPEINPKRPYGNSSVASDVIEILGWPEPPLVDDDAIGPEWEALFLRAEHVHRGTALALQIILSTKSFEPGVCWRGGDYDTLWHREAT